MRSVLNGFKDLTDNTMYACAVRTMEESRVGEATPIDGAATVSDEPSCSATKIGNSISNQTEKKKQKQRKTHPPKKKRRSMRVCEGDNEKEEDERGERKKAPTT